MDLTTSHFTRDTRTLLAPSTTRYPRYIAAVPHLHHTLTVNDLLFIRDKSTWPRPLRNSYNLGLLPLVKLFRIHTYCPFTPKKLDKSTLRYLSALTNLQELGIDGLQVPSFMPNIQQYFGRLAPILRLLALGRPRGTSRQILPFIGLFPNLQDLKVCYYFPIEEQECISGPDLAPLSVPRGLTLACFAKKELVKGMITFFGGLLFVTWTSSG